MYAYYNYTDDEVLEQKCRLTFNLSTYLHRCTLFPPSLFVYLCVCRSRRETLSLHCLIGLSRKKIVWALRDRVARCVILHLRANNLILYRDINVNGYYTFVIIYNNIIIYTKKIYLCRLLSVSYSRVSGKGRSLFYTVIKNRKQISAIPVTIYWKTLIVYFIEYRNCYVRIFRFDIMRMSKILQYYIYGQQSLQNIKIHLLTCWLKFWSFKKCEYNV